MVSYLRRKSGFRKSVFGEAVCVCEALHRFLLFIFQVRLQLLDPSPGGFHHVDVFLSAVGFQNLLALLVILDGHSVGLGVVGLGTSFFALFQKNHLLGGIGSP